MKIRRYIAAALACAAIFAPSAGHAVGEENVPISTSSCTIGDTKLIWDDEWQAEASVECTQTRDNLQTSFTVTQIQGVNSTSRPYLAGRTVIVSQHPTDVDGQGKPLTFVNCANDTSCSAFGRAPALGPGLYYVWARGVAQYMKNGTMLTRTAYYSACFVVTGEPASNGTEAQKVGNCLP